MGPEQMGHSENSFGTETMAAIELARALRSQLLDLYARTDEASESQISLLKEEKSKAVEEVRRLCEKNGYDFEDALEAIGREVEEEEEEEEEEETEENITPEN